MWSYCWINWQRHGLSAKFFEPAGVRRDTFLSGPSNPPCVLGCGTRRTNEICPVLLFGIERFLRGIERLARAGEARLLPYRFAAPLQLVFARSGRAAKSTPRRRHVPFPHCHAPVGAPDDDGAQLGKAAATVIVEVNKGKPGPGVRVKSPLCYCKLIGSMMAGSLFRTSPDRQRTGRATLQIAAKSGPGYVSVIQARAAAASRPLKMRTFPGSRKRNAFTVCRIHATSVTTAMRSQRRRCSIPTRKSSQIAPACMPGELRSDFVEKPNLVVPLQGSRHRGHQHIVIIFAGHAALTSNCDDIRGETAQYPDHGLAPFLPAVWYARQARAGFR